MSDNDDQNLFDQPIPVGIEDEMKRSSRCGTWMCRKGSES